MTLGTFEYTLFTFAWLAVLALLAQVGAYFWMRSERPFSALQSTQIPAIILGPFFLVVGRRFLGVNLLSGLRVDKSPTELIVTTLFPAFVLFFASGLFSNIFKNTQLQNQRWRGMYFVQFAKACGKSETRQTLGLTVIASLSESILQSAPVLFAELVIVEAVCNSFGLGYFLFDNLRQGEFQRSLLPLVFLTLAMFALCALVRTVLKKIGQRLETY